jgi:hypothetical protein
MTKTNRLTAPVELTADEVVDDGEAGGLPQTQEWVESI